MKGRAVYFLLHTCDKINIIRVFLFQKDNKEILSRSIANNKCVIKLCCRLLLLNVRVCIIKYKCLKCIKFSIFLINKKKILLFSVVQLHFFIYIIFYDVSVLSMKLRMQFLMSQNFLWRTNFESNLIPSTLKKSDWYSLNS